MSASLVGSEMCIRDSLKGEAWRRVNTPAVARGGCAWPCGMHVLLLCVLWCAPAFAVSTQSAEDCGLDAARGG
eukprot:9450968-Alexandrium_andersonii.AAC.1